MKKEQLQHLTEHIEDIKNGKIKDYVILGMYEDGSTLIHMNGRGPVIDGLIRQAQIQSDEQTKCYVNSEVNSDELANFLDKMLGEN